MRHSRRHPVVLTVALVCVCAPAMGQARSAYVWGNPRVSGIRTIGGDFASYSAGLGGLTSYAAPSANILGSSIASGGSFNLRRSAAAASGQMISGTAGVGSLGTGPLTGMSYGTEQIRLPTAGVSPAAAIAPDQMRLAGDAAIYLQTMQRPSDLAEDPDKPITSFVPSEPSLYQKHMREADSQFRRGRYVEASEAYNVALPLARQLPEVHLSLANAEFAHGGFHGAVFHLKKVLRLFPELPLVNMGLQSFYGEENLSDLDERREELAQRLKNPETDADLWLLLGYVDYFCGDIDRAAADFQSGRTVSERYDNKETLEALKAFWDSAVAAGKFTTTFDGSPLTTTAPATTAPSGTTPSESAPSETPPPPTASDENAPPEAAPSGETGLPEQNPTTPPAAE